MTTKEKILRKISTFYKGKVFISEDFLDITSTETIRRTLNRLVEDDIIKRVSKGFYYVPAYSKLIDEYEAVSINELAIAFARKYNWNIAPSGNTALNILGLTTQVPINYEYISSGPYKTYQVGNRKLAFKRVKQSEIANMSTLSATVIQAIKAKGENNIDQDFIKILRGKLSTKDIDNLLKETISAPAWIYEFIKNIGDY